MTSPARTPIHVMQRMDDDRLAWYLWIYEQWHYEAATFGGGSFGEGFSSRASGGIGTTGSREFESLYADVCRRCAEAVASIVDGLPAPEKTAIGIKHCGVAAVYRFRDPLDVVYARACEVVRRGLVQRGFE